MRNSFLCLFVFAVANMGAQNNMADILASIETNNPELKAGAQIVLSQKAEVSSQNTLEDPNFEFEHLWGADNAKDRKYDISVSQSFDFPSLYVQRNKNREFETYFVRWAAGCFATTNIVAGKGAVFAGDLFESLYSVGKREASCRRRVGQTIS